METTMEDTDGPIVPEASSTINTVPEAVTGDHSEGGNGKEEKEEEAPLQVDKATESTKTMDADEPPVVPSVMSSLDDMKNEVYFLYPDRNQRLSKFWILIILASIIATMGVAGDSSATVIGAMIVAPLMTPILGTMLSIVLTDGPNFMMSFCLVVTGAGSAVLIGYLFGLALYDDLILKENNSEVASRVNPKLTDLVGALATGMVGSIALVRKDIAGSMPGVAIAISLVPPLCVAGLTMSTGDLQDSAGAMLLFTTNFAAIVVMGVIVMYVYRVPTRATRQRARLRRTAIFVMCALLCIVAVPLVFSSMRIVEQYTIQDCVTAEVNKWGEPHGWSTQVIIVKQSSDVLEADVTITGEPPFPHREGLKDEKIKVCNVDQVSIRFVPEWTIEL